nr:putative methyltransferase-like protein 15 [Polyrhizophydium stewartii]
MDCEIICIDQDPLAIERAMELASRPEYRGRLFPIHSRLGEDKNSRKIARAIANARTNAYIRTTMQLSTIIAKALGQEEAWQHQGGKHPAMRTIRIYINDELRELTRGLVAAEHLLRPDARCVVLTFHSLEDRIAKRFFRAIGARAAIDASSDAQSE